MPDAYIFEKGKSSTRIVAVKFLCCEMLVGLHAIEFCHAMFGDKVCSLGSQLPSALSLEYIY